MRALEGIPVDRARLRMTLSYPVFDNLSVGLEWNPIGDGDLGPIANWRILDETERRPALILGTSSDRIGTPADRAVYLTASKDLERWTGLPVAPYAGVTYSGFDEKLREIGGVYVRWTDRLSSTHLWDGVNLHHLLDWRFDSGTTLGVVVAEQDGEHYAGGTLSFGIPIGR